MKETCVEKQFDGNCDIAFNLSNKMDKRLIDMEEKIDVLVDNQEELKEKINKLYDALIGNELSDNRGLIHDIKDFKKQVDQQFKDTNNRISILEKFLDNIKTFWWILTIIAVVIAFTMESLFKYLSALVYIKK